jgi:hypothetical protein
MKCSVCERDSDNDIPCSSTLGAVSNLLCRECLGKGAEPLHLCEFIIEENGGLKNCNEWFKNLVTWKDGSYTTVGEAFA